MFVFGHFLYMKRHIRVGYEEGHCLMGGLQQSNNAPEVVSFGGKGDWSCLYL